MDLITSLNYIKQNCISPSKKPYTILNYIKLLHCNSSCLPLPRLKLAIEITNWISTFDVFYRVLSFSFLFPICSFLKCLLFCKWRLKFRHRGSLDPQTTETTDSTTSGDWDDWEAMESAAMAAMECEYEPMLNPKVERSWKIKHWNALECTGNWSILKLSCRWLCKSGYRHMRPRLAVTAGCKSPLKTLKTFNLRHSEIHCCVCWDSRTLPKDSKPAAVWYSALMWADVRLVEIHSWFSCQ
jgi:hypothetical protein